MKNFPSKVTWIAEHRDGDKCYYYPGTGWVGSTDGLVRGFDATDFEEVEVPDDATHVQIVNGKVQYVRYLDPLACIDIWHDGAWQKASTLSKLRGTVVRIADGSVFGSGTPPAVTRECDWVDVSEGQPSGGSARAIEVQFGNGGRAIVTIAELSSGPKVNVTRWRYAS